jgi:transmembrane sensor
MSDMKTNNQIDRLLAEESSAWLERLKKGKPEDRAEFAEWTMESRRHLRHFLMMTALDEELRSFDPERKHAVPDVRHQGAEVVALTEHGAEPHPGTVAATPSATRVSSYRWWSLAATLVVFVGIALTAYLLRWNSGWQEFSTAVGEQRSIELLDGSLVHLNTGSRVAVRLSEGTRDIRLLEGEALFKVHKDPNRPFRVHTFGAVIQAIGTQFNVYRRMDGTTVSVVEGRVQISSGEPEVSPRAEQPGSGDTRDGAGSANGAGQVVEAASPLVTRLAAGEEASIDSSGRIETQHNADVSRSTAWRERRLVFKQDSLGKIVTEFNRYNRVPQFKLIGTSVSTRRYSGAFSVDDPESLSSLLASEPDLLVQRSGDDILVRARNETGSFASSP